MDDFPWFAPISKFEQAFDVIEESTVSLFECLPDCNIPDTAPKLALGTRLDILEEVLPRYSGPEYCELLICFKEVAALSPKRALIAHNAMWFGYQAETNPALTRRTGSKRQRRVSLEEIQELAETAQLLATRVRTAAGEVLRNCE